MKARSRTRYARAEGGRVSRSHRSDVPRQDSLDLLLGLPGWKVLSALTAGDDHLVIRDGHTARRLPVVIRSHHIGFPETYDREKALIVSDDEEPLCRQCGQVLRWIKHGVLTRTFSDIPLHERPVRIEVVRQRFKCAQSACRNTTLQPMPNMHEVFGMTQRLVDYIRHRYSWWTIQQLADETGLSRKQIGAVVREHKRETLRANWISRIWSIGIDEVEINDGIWTVVVDNRSGRLLKLIEGKKPDIAPVLEEIAANHPITTVSIDRSGTYRKTARRVFGKHRPYPGKPGRSIKGVKIVADKWHVLRSVDDAFHDTLKALKTKADAPFNYSRRLSRFQRIFRTAPDRRSRVQERFMELMLRNNPEIETLYSFRRDFYSVYRAESLEEATVRLDEWLFRCGHIFPVQFGRAATSLSKWREEILAYFKGGATNARAEYMNRLLKSIHRSRGKLSVESRAVKALFRNIAPTPDLMKCFECNSWFDSKQVGYRLWSLHPEAVSDQAETISPQCNACATGAWVGRNDNSELVVRTSRSNRRRITVSRASISSSFLT